MTQLVVRGRYQIIPEGETEAKPHTRVTNFAKKLEDSYGLTQWGKRMVLLGMASRPDIVGATLAAGDDWRELNRLTDAAMDAAKANVRRESGTAIHSLLEQVDAGMTVEVPSPWREDIDAYLACMADVGATVVRSEDVVVLPDLGLAGRFDRLVSVNGEQVIADIKTGNDLSHSWLSIAIQLACYSRAATIYHPDTQTHEPMPAVNQRKGLVIHLPAGSGHATAYWVNLSVGVRGMAMTERVLALRKEKDIATPVASTLTALRSFTVERVAAIIAAEHGQDLASRWPAGVPTLKASSAHSEAQLDAILAVCTTVEGIHKMPFPDSTDPRKQATKKPKKGSK